MGFKIVAGTLLLVMSFAALFNDLFLWLFVICLILFILIILIRIGADIFWWGRDKGNW